MKRNLKEKEDCSPQPWKISYDGQKKLPDRQETTAGIGTPTYNKEISQRYEEDTG